MSREITLGPLTGNRIEVANGLEPGELLVVGGQHSVVPGDTVNPEMSASK